MLNLATRLLARILNMPEPLVHNTGVFVFVHVQAVETSIGKAPAASAPVLAPIGVPRPIARPPSPQGDLS